MKTTDDSEIAAMLDEAGRRVRRAASDRAVPPLPSGVLRAPRRRSRPLVAGLLVVGMVVVGITYLVARSDRPAHVVLVRPATTAHGSTITTATVAAPIPAGAERLPPARLSGRYGQSVVWTGAELIVWGGEQDPDARLLRDGAAYSVTTGTWSPIAPASVGGGRAALWSDGRMIVFGVDNSRDATAYDPATDAWTSVASLPIDLDINSLSAVE
ncbi:MAG TPA: hypothetical protein VGI86_10535, partial [Acidimicrobiia bacterium]